MLQMNQRLENLARQLTERFLMDPESEGFGYREPNTIVVYARNSAYAKRIEQYIATLNLNDIQFELHVVGKTYLLGRKHGA